MPTVGDTITMQQPDDHFGGAGGNRRLLRLES